MTAPPPHRMTARDKFTIGQRVKLSSAGLAIFGVTGRSIYGEVVGFGRTALHVVRVVKDGNRAASAYHMDYWTGAE